MHVVEASWIHLISTSNFNTSLKFLFTLLIENTCVGVFVPATLPGKCSLYVLSNGTRYQRRGTKYVVLINMTLSTFHTYLEHRYLVHLDCHSELWTAHPITFTVTFSGFSHLCFLILRLLCNTRLTWDKVTRRLSHSPPAIQVRQRVSLTASREQANDIDMSDSDCGPGASNKTS